MGVKLEETEASLIIYQSKLYRAQAHGYSDHRTIMALAVAGLLTDGETIIDTAEGINKTFPNFVDMMKTIGAKMELQ
jgi:3-phosphoshikimate 1-carboxyvinyltransferase